MALRLTPKAAKNAITGIAADADETGGGGVLRAGVTAAPEGGKANAALLKLLAKEWRIAKSDLTITKGATGRRKTIAIKGDAGTILPRLEAWMEARYG